MRVNRHVSALSLLVTLFASCSNPAPPTAPAPVTAQAPAPAVEQTEAARPTIEAPKTAVAPRPAPAPKTKEAPAPSTPVTRAPNGPSEVPVTERPAPEPVTVPTRVSDVVPPAPPAPREPTTRRVTVPSGTVISVQMVDAVDSETDRVGQTYRATLDAPLAADRDTIAPRGSDVFLRLTHVESAGKLTGRSEVSLELDRIVVGGRSYTVASNTYEKQAGSQTVETAKKTGIGAAIGAAVGAIAGGGKGAAIGAGVGGGTGVAIEAATKSKQVRIEPESRVDFHLEQPVEVTVDARPSASPAPRDSSSGPRLLNGRATTANDSDDRLNLSGKWRVSMDSPEGKRTLDMTLKEADGRLDGTLYDRGRGQALKGSIRGDSITFSTNSMRFEGRIVNDRLRGTVIAQGDADIRSGRTGGRNDRTSNESFNWTADRND